MVRNIIYAVIMAAILVPSWQIGSIILEKQSVFYMLQEHANSIKRSYHPPETVRDNLKKNLELKGLPTAFTFELLNSRKVEIGYRYNGAATVFGYTYYQTAETLSAVTAD
jgi:hypothetical protein